MGNRDIVTSYKHEYKTRFIVDTSSSFQRLNELDLHKYDRVIVIIDENVFKIYGDVLIQKLNHKKDTVFIHEVKAEEYSKSIKYYPNLVNFFEENTVGRYDAVVAVGGGIIIDLVSFTVSTYMRGIPLFIIATTLIGQTDASTAGKTCLNSENTKNLLGTFYYPQIVYNNIDIMRTNTKRIIRQGLSEAFKYSLLTDGDLLTKIVEFQNGEFQVPLMQEIVEKTISSRIQIRQIDPLASNLGHTFGHALEKYFEYEILHGDAILIGTVMAINYAVQKGIMEKKECEKIFDFMIKAHLNIFISQQLDIKKMISYMKKDKKSSSKKLHLVMIKEIGRPYNDGTPFFETDYDEVEIFLNEFMESYKYKKEKYITYVNREELL